MSKFARKRFRVWLSLVSVAPVPQLLACQHRKLDLLSKIVGATKKWLRKRLELEKEGQIITPKLHLLHVSVTLRSLDQKKWETKEERDRGKLAADFYLCSAGFDLQADEGSEL